MPSSLSVASSGRWLSLATRNLASCPRTWVWLADGLSCRPVLRSHRWPGAVLWSEPSPFVGGHTCLATPDGPALSACLRPRAPQSSQPPAPRRQCVASGAASSPAPCPVASGGPAASPALSSGSGRKAARGGDGGAGITPRQARAGARPCRGRVKGRFAGYVPNLWGQQGASTVGPDGLLFPVGCELDPQALAGPVRGGRVCLGGGKGPCARGEGQLLSGTGQGHCSAVTKSHGAGVPATPVRTR